MGPSLGSGVQTTPLLGLYAVAGFSKAGSLVSTPKLQVAAVA